ncbi:MAG: hypothetical protein CMQ40_07780 [Gammaproteobacteria bacterium]|mgnify:CR=1 FL=1|nr:hypothetical protein [Gammaproteobacteria bacterium]|tara:strand:- start:930 stop:1949 length:1020 start_codon:yes stop_codon:yes gene_type:complete
MELTIAQALHQGVAAHKEGKIQEAEHLYREILKSQPLHPDANHNLGVLAVAVNKVEAALPLLKTALKANPETEQFWVSYIDALIKEKQFEEAKQLLDQAKTKNLEGEKLNALESQLDSRIQTISSANPSQEQLNSLLEHYQSGRYDDAEKLAISLTHEFPQHQFGWKALGVVLGQTGRKSEALEANQKAVALSDGDAEAHNNLGFALQELGRFDEAEASLRNAVRLKPGYAEAHNNLGNALKELSRFDEAEASYEQAFAVKPDFAEARYNLGIMLGELSRFDEAEASLRHAIALKPGYAEAHSNLGAILLEKGQHREGLAEIQIGDGIISFDLKTGLST